MQLAVMAAYYNKIYKCAAKVCLVIQFG